MRSALASLLRVAVGVASHAACAMVFHCVFGFGLGCLRALSIASSFTSLSASFMTSPHMSSTTLLVGALPFFRLAAAAETGCPGLMAVGKRNAWSII